MKGRIKRIHVNRQKIAQNAKGNEYQAPLAVRVGKEVLYGVSVEIKGPSRIVDAEQCGLKQLSCGARVYIETNAEVHIHTQDGYIDEVV